MAEGEIADTPTIIPSDLSGTSIDVDPRLTECAICLEQLQHPKSLPCLHTFCEECLNVYITKQSDTTIVSFPCPVCRAETIPVDPKEEKGNWAKQFPTNNFIIEMSKGYDRKSLIHECDPCKKRDVRNVAAKVWWKESNRFLCDMCLGKLQDLIDDDHGHTLVDVTTGRKFLPIADSTYMSCPKHKKEMDLYCEDHQSVCCSTCIAVAHRRCDVVITLSEYGDKVRSSSRIEDMRTSLKEVRGDMEHLTEDIRKQTEHLGNGRDLVMKTITSLRQKFEEHLNKLQCDLTNELTMAYKVEKQKLDGMLHKCERMCNEIKTTQLLSEADVIQKDDIQMLSLLQRGTIELKFCQDLITQVADTFTTVDLKLDHDDEEMVKNALIFGRLNITRTRRSFPANHLSRAPLSLAKVKEVGKLCIKTDSDEKRCHATGLVYLSNGHIILTDHDNKKVKMFKESGELVDELSLQGNPWDLCLVDDNTVAVSIRDKQIISIIKIKSSKLSHVPEAQIKTEKLCYGITYKDGRYVMATGSSSKREIYSMTKTNNMIQVLHQPNSYPWYLVNDPNSSDVIVSLHSDRAGDTAVYRLSPDGTTTEIAKVGLMSQGNGVDVDREGNVYVCGRESNNVVQISQDGNTVRELVTSSEGLREPLTLSVYNNKFVLSNDAHDTSDDVKIYELY